MPFTVGCQNVSDGEWGSYPLAKPFSEYADALQLVEALIVSPGHAAVGIFDGHGVKEGDVPMQVWHVRLPVDDEGVECRHGA